MGAHDLIWMIGISVILGLVIIVVSIWLSSLLPDVATEVTDPSVASAPVTNPDGTTSPDIGTVFTCDPGECKFSLLTGVKTCPVADETIDFQPSTEACTAPFLCTFGAWTNALQPDGSTDGYGRCQPGDQCNCLRRAICNSSTSSAWDIENDQYVSVEPWTQAWSRSRGVDDPLPLPVDQFCYLPGVEVFNIDQVSCTKGSNLGQSDTLADLIACIDKYEDSLLELCPGGLMAIYAETVDPTSALGDSTVVCVMATPDRQACAGTLRMSPSTGAVSCE